jgi:hypothetical protein
MLQVLEQWHVDLSTGSNLSQRPAYHPSFGASEPETALLGRSPCTGRTLAARRRCALRSLTGTPALVLCFQVLPLVKAFFVLCEARTAHLPPPFAARRAGSQDMARGVSMEITLPEHLVQPTPAAAQEKFSLEAQLPFLRCPSSLQIPCLCVCFICPSRVNPCCWKSLLCRLCMARSHATCHAQLGRAALAGPCPSSRAGSDISLQVKTLCRASSNPCWGQALPCQPFRAIP